MAKRTFDHAAVEKKWQKRWAELQVYKTAENRVRPKKYVLDMFPYPSGEGLHVGHPKGYIATDIYSRYSRMKGHEVLHPMGWDAFGLPAENYAIKNKIHPRAAVDKNIANFKHQLAHIGFDYDWTREINTTDPAFYKWTQWIFLKLFEHGLAFQSNEPINWCPSCLTGLANEDLDGTVCERCGTPVEKKRLPQWVLKITDYADRLLKDLDTLDWPEHIKEAQRNWIGRSEGAEIDFPISFTREGTGKLAQITVFTTRPDTLFGATYLVLAPEHPWLVEALSRGDVFENTKEVAAYVAQAAAKTEIERSAEEKEKTGVELRGIRAMNPATNEAIPVFTADYVLGSYGTGAIMAVPAHDERDFLFAKKFELPIRYVIDPVTGETQDNPKHKEKVVAVVEDGEGNVLTIKWPQELGGRLLVGGTIEEGEDPLTTALREIAEETGYTDIEPIERAEETVHHSYFAFSKNQATVAHTTLVHCRLRTDVRQKQQLEENEAGKFEVEWVSVARARKEIHDDQHQRALSRFTGSASYSGDGLLARSGSFSGKKNRVALQEIVAMVGGRMVTRYKIRDWVFSRQRYWGEPIPIIHCATCGAVPVPYEDLPVTLPDVERYEPTGTGESPLAAISDWVNTTCPKCKGPAKRETNTMPQWAGSSWYYLRYMDPHNDEQLVSASNEKYWGPVDVYVGGDHAVRHLIYARFWHKFLYDISVVTSEEPFARLEFLGFILAEDGRKMSKRLGNVINPDDVVAQFGADAFRLYEMFMGPFSNTTAWSTASIAGSARFVERVWNAQDLVVDAPVPALLTPLAQTVKKVSEDIEAFKFNTAVSQLMIFINAIEEAGAIDKSSWSAFVRVLAPFAPHLCDELWSCAGEAGSVHTAPWPEYDSAALVESRVTVGVQVNGKRRGEVTLANDASEEEALAAVYANDSLNKLLSGRTLTRTIYVPGRILNIVAPGP